MPITPLQAELRHTGNILTDSFRDVGQRAIRKEELGLQRGLMEHQLGRQKEMDALQRPGLQARAEEDKIRLQQLNEPVTIGSMFPDHWALMHATQAYDLASGFGEHKAPAGQKSLVEKIADMYEARIDTDQKSQTYGKFVRKDGSFLRNKDLMVKSRELKALILANTDPLETIQDQTSRYLEKLQGLQEGTPEYAAVQENLKKALDVMNDPKKQLQILQQHRDQLSKMPKDDEMDSGIAMLDGKIAGIQKEYGELAKEKREQEHDIRMEGIKHGHKMKEKDVTTGPKAPQFLNMGDKAFYEKSLDEIKKINSAMMDYYSGVSEFGFDIKMTPEQFAELDKKKATIEESLEKRFGGGVVQEIDIPNPKVAGGYLNKIVKMHQALMEKGQNPMENPQVKAATEAFLAAYPGAEVNFVNAMNALGVKGPTQPEVTEEKPEEKQGMDPYSYQDFRSKEHEAYTKGIGPTAKALGAAKGWFRVMSEDEKTKQRQQRYNR